MELGIVSGIYAQGHDGWDNISTALYALDRN